MCKTKQKTKKNLNHYQLLTWTAWRFGWAASRCCARPWSWPAPRSSPASRCPPWWGRGRALRWRPPWWSTSGGRWRWNADPTETGEGLMETREEMDKEEGRWQWEGEGGVAEWKGHEQDKHCRGRGLSEEGGGVNTTGERQERKKGRIKMLDGKKETRVQ